MHPLLQEHLADLACANYRLQQALLGIQRDNQPHRIEVLKALESLRSAAHWAVALVRDDHDIEVLAGKTKKPKKRKKD